MSAAPLRCPECRRGTLELHRDGRIGIPVVSSHHRRDAAVPIVWQARPFAACNFCEYCTELPRGNRP